MARSGLVYDFYLLWTRFGQPSLVWDEQHLVALIGATNASRSPALRGIKRLLQPAASVFICWLVLSLLSILQ